MVINPLIFVIIMRQWWDASLLKTYVNFQNIQSEVERLWKIHNIQAELETERLEEQEQEDMLCSSQLSCLNYRGLLASALLSFHTTLGRNSEPGWSKYFLDKKTKICCSFIKFEMQCSFHENLSKKSSAQPLTNLSLA